MVLGRKDRKRESSLQRVPVADVHPCDRKERGTDGR